MKADELRVADEAGVRWVTLHRPESKNGLTEELNAAIIDAMESAGRERAVRCVVLTGAGGSFSSGLDLKDAMQHPEVLEHAEEHLRKYFHALILSIRRLDKPVIALVDGPAVGYGCDLALACDLRLGTPRARFGEIFVKRGLMPDGGGTFALPRLVGLGKALELLFTGDLVEAEAAHSLGLLNRIVPTETALDETRAFAARLAAGPPLVYARIKRAVYGALATPLEDALAVEAEGQQELLRSRDFIEGVTAFLQKRPPVFTGE